MTITQTARFGLTQWNSGDDAVGRAYFLADNLSIESLGAIFQSGLEANRPLATDDIAERSFWYSTDVGVLYFSDGSSWRSLNAFALSSDVYEIVAGSITGSVGTSTRIARSDHKHPISTATAVTISGSNAVGTSTSLARADHNHAIGAGVVGTTQIADTNVTLAKLNSNVVSSTGAILLGGSGLALNTSTTIGVSSNAPIVNTNSIGKIHLTTDVAGNGLSGGNNTALSVNVDNVTIEISSGNLRLKDDAVDKTKIAADIAGAGLVQATGGELDVYVDNGSIEIFADALRVKDGGIGTAKIVDRNVTSAKIQLNPVLTGLSEKWNVVASAPSGTVNFDARTASIYYYTSNTTANWNVNFRGDGSTTLNSILANGEAITLGFLVTNGGTAYKVSTVQVDGTTRTVKWQGGYSSGAANQSDLWLFTIIKTASSTFSVFGSVARYV